ncbi:MAG: NADH-quinone oxidoreductase subunit H [Thermaerobacter sp.]|nr:NADH-quinone oxidoreductase subunit H [Thermaerobacter sp.]
MFVTSQILQMLFVLLFAPILKGMMDKFKARGMRRVGPPVLQPYRNLYKWFHKETLWNRETTSIRSIAPVLYFSAPLIVTLLIPVLTRFPLPLAFMADMLGGGMILGSAGLILLLAAADTGSPFTGIAVSRVRFIGTLAEPLTLTALFTAAAIGKATIPYAVNQVLGGTALMTPSHALLLVAWTLLILAGTGRLPVDNPDSSQELSLIDPNRTFEASGTDLALYEWGGWMKFIVLGIILVNVLGTPWGLAGSLAPVAIGIAILATAAKLTVLGFVVVLVELSFAKLRLLRIAEYLSVSVVVAALAALAIAIS